MKKIEDDELSTSCQIPAFKINFYFWKLEAPRHLCRLQSAEHAPTLLQRSISVFNKHIDIPKNSWRLEARRQLSVSAATCLLGPDWFRKSGKKGARSSRIILGRGTERLWNVDAKLHALASRDPKLFSQTRNFPMRWAGLLGCICISLQLHCCQVRTLFHHFYSVAFVSCCLWMNRGNVFNHIEITSQTEEMEFVSFATEMKDLPIYPNSLQTLAYWVAINARMQLTQMCIFHHRSFYLTIALQTLLSSENGPFKWRLYYMH